MPAINRTIHGELPPPLDSAHPFKGYEQIISAYFEALAHQDATAGKDTP